MTDPYLGEIRVSATNVVPRNFMPCHGQTLQIQQNQALFALLGTEWGGDARTTMLLPDLRGKKVVGVGKHEFGPVDGTTAAIELAIDVQPPPMPNPGTDFAKIRAFAFGFAPRGTISCQGQSLKVADHNQLFGLIGHTYGGEGEEFALPNLDNRSPIGFEGSKPGTATASTLQLNMSTNLKAQDALIAMASYDFAPRDSELCRGQSLSQSEYADLFELIGTKYGGEAPNFDLPDLTLRTPLGDDQEDGVGTKGDGTLAMNFIICTEGIFPPRS
ncbi:MAG: tail fiber protein [Myxococcota bacterium]